MTDALPVLTVEQVAEWLAYYQWQVCGLKQFPGREARANIEADLWRQALLLATQGFTLAQAVEQLAGLPGMEQLATVEQRAEFAERRVKELQELLESREFYDLTPVQQDRFRAEMRNEMLSNVRREVEQTINYYELPPETKRRVKHQALLEAQRERERRG
jgi:hypothetical protein